MYVLGMSESGHNAAACLLYKGKLLHFAEEERFTRIKSAPNSYPIQASVFCLNAQNIRINDIACIAIGWNVEKYCGEMQAFYKSLSEQYQKDTVTIMTEEMLLERFRKDRVVHRIQEGFRSVGIGEKLPPIVFFDHHLAHACSTFYCSGQEEAIIFTIDAAGEDIATAVFRGHNLDINTIDSYPLPHSLGWFYSMATEYIGFLPNQHEGKVMGLAPYGQDESKVRDVLNRVLYQANGKYQVDPTYIFYGKHTYGTRFTDRLVEELGPPRSRYHPINDHHRNVAYVAQDILEQTILHLVKKYMATTNTKNLCLAGGVAMNCKLNGLIARLKNVENLFIQPASQDSGTALGAAMLASKDLGYDPRFEMTHPYWGPSYDNGEIERFLELANIRYKRLENPSEIAADYLAREKIVGWFQGRMEMGSRALGSRSILANPSTLAAKDTVNNKVKFREVWRPFAPALRQTNKDTLFHEATDSYFMMCAFQVRELASRQIPAAIHIDGSARPQTVPPQEPYKRYWQLLRDFEEKASVPAILNTSFNIKGEPIVCTPQDAIRCFFSTGLDALFIEDFLIEKQ